MPTAAEEADGGRTRVTWKRTHRDGDGDSEGSGEFDTVLVATGRDPETASLNLGAAGVELTKEGYIRTSDEATSANGIYALGDVSAERRGKFAELTPVAARVGRLLARRLYGGDSEVFDDKNVPTAVFTPKEYACVGWSEEEAVDRLGEGRLEARRDTCVNSLRSLRMGSSAAVHPQVYHTSYAPLESRAIGRDPNGCYAKILCDRQARARTSTPNGTRSPCDDPSVVSHRVRTTSGSSGCTWSAIARRRSSRASRSRSSLAPQRRVPRTVMITQMRSRPRSAVERLIMSDGLVMASRDPHMPRAQATYDRVVGIHPCDAEDVVSLSVTKRSGESCERTGC